MPILCLEATHDRILEGLKAWMLADVCKGEQDIGGHMGNSKWNSTFTRVKWHYISYQFSPKKESSIIATTRLTILTCVCRAMWLLKEGGIKAERQVSD